jgi:hypothetical protein
MTMRKPLLALFALMAAPALAAAQETLPRLGGQEVIVHDHEHRVQVSLGLYGRISGIDGELDPDVPVDYSDLFGAGGGVMLEVSILWDSGQHWKAGPYLSISGDTYEGEKDTDFFGDSLEADDMDISTLLVGFKSIFDFAPFWYGEAHGAIGIATYGEVDGVLTVGGVPADVVIFEESSVFAFDLGGRIGFQAERFFAEAGFGLRVQGPPENGDLDFDSSAPAEFAFEFGAGFRF